MVITVIHAHGYNRGDEAAVCAMIDELCLAYKDVEIQLQMSWVEPYPDINKNVTIIPCYEIGGIRTKLEYILLYISKGKITFTDHAKAFVEAIMRSDIILHAPGGPSIGDLYRNSEWNYLKRLLFIRRLGKPYIFYAPSMGPFNDRKRNIVRRFVLNGAKMVFLRDKISLNYVQELGLNTVPTLTMDSALQHPIDMRDNEEKLRTYKELSKFLADSDKVVGVTITDLLWHPVHSKNPEITENIKDSFTSFLYYLVDNGYSLLFIPQLFGKANDYELMKAYDIFEDKSYIMSDRYDAYFQQFIISRLYAVVGMRYHSNIFSAKMMTPFISVSYEQKMQGFMEMAGLEEYCININQLSFDNLIQKYENLTTNYIKYKEYLQKENKELMKKSYQSTENVRKLIHKLGISEVSNKVRG